MARSVFLSALASHVALTALASGLGDIPFPDLIPRRLTPEEDAAYRAHLDEQVEAQKPRMDAAEAKRERRRIKLARTVG